MIESYRFGHIVIDKVSYRNDVIVFPDRVQADWWRKEGHKLQLNDIQDAIDDAQPRTLVVGTGKFGLMKVNREVRALCEKRGITLYAEATDKAVKMYNRLILSDPDVLGAFHLTC